MSVSVRSCWREASRPELVPGEADRGQERQQGGGLKDVRAGANDDQRSAESDDDRGACATARPARLSSGAESATTTSGVVNIMADAVASWMWGSAAMNTKLEAKKTRERPIISRGRRARSSAAPTKRSEEQGHPDEVAQKPRPHDLGQRIVGREGLRDGVHDREQDDAQQHVRDSGARAPGDGLAHCELRIAGSSRVGA